MANLSDIIEDFIKKLIDDTNGTLEIRRNELASQFNCVPSQINYVLDTRFTTERGYHIESRRGGGGYILIKRVNVDSTRNYIMHIISSIGDSISNQICEMFIDNFVGYNIFTNREAILIKIATSDKILGMVARPHRDFLRANILKNMLVSILL